MKAESQLDIRQKEINTLSLLMAYSLIKAMLLRVIQKAFGDHRLQKGKLRISLSENRF